MDHLGIEQRGDVTLVTLDNPPFNTVHAEIMREASRRFCEMAASSDVQAVVLTGAGSDYSRGMDRKVAENFTDETREETREAINHMMADMHRLPCPLVSAVNGHSIGAGGIMMLCSDWVVAAEGGYKIGLPEAKAGLPFPAVPQAIIDHWLDPVWRRRLALTSQLFGPEQAAATGLVDEIVSPETLIDIAVQRASELASQPAFRDCKRQLRAKANAEIDAILAK
ncbi:probable enoyl-CoA hydratase [Erythrobacter sp. NAP1]|uniref:enoyl-CoA hydratase/isomerase family protein n=1 Tax=Erythrobacter sp. NAP1 TaxID=237727 RepID=UPI0000686B50|nr:enoyl-CoA hydratase/isomerase family protein [Erythrobacter sp. NAP1]EAQ29197.1 probable enoyl-CoA hydratase [Erythrobacter sp. NAP1]